MDSRVFVMGATGYLGSAIAARAARAGHEVFGLTRDPARGAMLAALGVTPVVGDLRQPETFAAVIKNCDIAVHAAYDPEDNAARDQLALEALRHASQDGRVRRVLYTSGVWVYGDTGGRVVDETTPLHPIQLVRWRAAHEEVALDLAAHEVEVTIFRPGIAYGESRGIVGAMFDMARDRGHVVWPGDGTQRWCLVHRDDVAEAYRLAIERPARPRPQAGEPVPGERYVLADGSSHTAREVAQAVARVTGVPARAWEREDVLRQLGAFGQALMTSQRANPAKARRELDWAPRHTSFVAEAQDLYREWQTSQDAPVA